MSISVYLAVNDEEIVNHPKNLIVQLGFGFHSDGTVRSPRQIKSGIVVVDDLHMPNFSVSALQILKSKFRACILDFERPPTPLHKKLIQGIPKILAITAKYHSFAPQALPIVSCLEPCNSWEQFLKQTEQQFPNGWMLEITPWHHEKIGTMNQKEGFLSYAVCRYEKRNNHILYYDTKETINEKLKLAEQYHCKAAIALLQEVRNLK